MFEHNLTELSIRRDSMQHNDTQHYNLPRNPHHSQQYLSARPGGSSTSLGVQNCASNLSPMLSPSFSSSSRASSYLDPLMSSSSEGEDLTPVSSFRSSLGSTPLPSNAATSTPRSSLHEHQYVPCMTRTSSNAHAGQNSIILDVNSFDSQSGYMRTPLIWAIIDGSIDDVNDLLITGGADIEARDGNWDWTPLMWCIMEEKPEIFALLIDHGADLRATDCNSGRTPLLWAARFGDRTAITLLVARDISLLHVRDFDDMTALALAYDAGHMETAQSLLKLGHTPDCHLVCGTSVLAMTIVTKHIELMKTLLENGADPNNTGASRTPALIISIEHSAADIAQDLLDAGADVNCVGQEGSSALIIAIKTGSFRCAVVLLEHGAEVDAVDGEHKTALLWAIIKENVRMVELLRRHGASVNVRDKDGITAQQWAKWSRIKDVIRLVASRP